LLHVWKKKREKRHFAPNNNLLLNFFSFSCLEANFEYKTETIIDAKDYENPADKKKP